MELIQQPTDSVLTPSALNAYWDPRQMELTGRVYYPATQHRRDSEHSVEYEPQEGAQRDLSFSSLSFDVVSPSRGAELVGGRLDPYSDPPLHHSFHPPLEHHPHNAINAQMIHIQHRLQSLEAENHLKDQEFYSVRCRAEALDNENKLLQDRYQRLQERMWSDRQYFAQYARLFLDVQESGMRRELINEEKESWAELKLYHVSFLLHQKALKYQDDSQSLVGLTASNTRTATLSPSRPNKMRSDSLSVSPRRHFQRPPFGVTSYSPDSVREASPASSSNRTPDGSYHPSAREASPLPVYKASAKDVQQLDELLNTQRINIAELQAAVAKLEKEKADLTSELSCERCLTVEMQEEIDDLIVSELILREEGLRASIEQNFSNERLALFLNHYRIMNKDCPQKLCSSSEGSRKDEALYEERKNDSFKIHENAEENVLSQIGVLQESVSQLKNLSEEYFSALCTKTDGLHDEIKKRLFLQEPTDIRGAVMRNLEKRATSEVDSNTDSGLDEQKNIRKQLDVIAEYQSTISQLLDRGVTNSTNSIE